MTFFSKTCRLSVNKEKRKYREKKEPKSNIKTKNRHFAAIGPKTFGQLTETETDNRLFY